MEMKEIVISLFFFLFCLELSGQTTIREHEVRCYSTEYEKHLREKHSNRATTVEFESWINKKIDLQKNQLNKEERVAIITIPVVVHVIHNGDAYGENENIRDEQVFSQIQVLNDDFRRRINTAGYNTNPVGADVEIQFCLAKTNPDGNLTNGIDRVDFGRVFFNKHAIENELKPRTIWNPEEYLNIWTCVFGDDLINVQGYAQFPSSSGLSGLGVNEGIASTDGVVIGYNKFGSSVIFPEGVYNAPYDRGRTTTHEIGHWLGLYHIWGDNSDCTLNNDFCADTPVSLNPNRGCPKNVDSCPLDRGKDMVENYMDYTDDICMNIFTNDQKKRIRTVLKNAERRRNLERSTKCQEPNLIDEDFGMLSKISIYPNPVNAELTIAMPNEDELPEAYVLLNSIGQEVAAKKDLKIEDLKLVVSHLTNGIYFLKVQKAGKKVTLKFVKK
ncbi:hypothetical protein BWK62_07245 [Flavobacterium oreochromis]|nr:hypothetical protein BWK62_07245 [Flavobacterium oreochromis]OWP78025.1 hypothetical protein BWG23_03195 [Flavobacterium oreochromis]POR24800.1 hypothetical protein BWK58_07615 [Flavobacterium columnare]